MAALIAGLYPSLIPQSPVDNGCSVLAVIMWVVWVCVCVCVCVCVWARCPGGGGGGEVCVLFICPPP